MADAAAGAAAGADAGQGAGGSPLGGGGQGGGAQLPEFYSQLSEEHRTALAPKAFADVNALAGAYREVERKVSEKGIILPGKDAKPEDWNPVWDAIGRPPSPDKYELNGFQRPEGWNADAEKAYLADAHKQGLTTAQARFNLEHYRDFAVASIAAAEAAQAKQLKDWNDGLKAEWGGDYDANLDKAKLTVKAVAEAALGDKAGELAAYLDGDKLGWHPGLTKVFAALHEHLQLGEDGKLVGRGGGGGDGLAGMSPEAAKVEIAATLKASDADQKHPYLNPGHEKHAEVRARMTRLYALAFPGTEGAGGG